MLRYLLARFNPKVSSIEEMTKIKTLTLDRLLSTFTSYEMIISNGKDAPKESTFKVDKNPKE